MQLQNFLDALPFLSSGTQLLQKQAEQPSGLQTGLQALDSQLLWKGLPRGALSLILSPPGLGATSFWLEVARRAAEEKKWSLWVSQQSTLFAPALWHRGVSLKRLYAVRPQGEEDWLFTLRESLESNVFTLIGCEVPSLFAFRKSLPQLKSLAEKSKTALVFLTQDRRDLKRTQQMNWVAELRPQSLLIHKTKNRPSFQIPWRGPYAHFLSQLSPARSSFPHRGFLELHSTSALSRARAAVWRCDEDPLTFQELEKPA